MTTKLNHNTAQKVSSRDKSNRLGQSINRLPTLEGAFVADAKAAKEKYERTEFIRTNTKKIDKTSAGSTRKVTEKPFLHLADSESTKNRRGQTSAGPLSFKLGELGRLNERKGVTLNLQDGTGGPNNRKGALGDDEPGANINNGVSNGTLDKQGNPSSRPSFGVDSRRATGVDDDYWLNKDHKDAAQSEILTTLAGAIVGTTAVGGAFGGIFDAFGWMSKAGSGEKIRL